MFKKVLGTRDILPEEARRWQKIEETSRRIFSLYNYREVRTPLIEEAGLFRRGLGDSAEIVQKQMFVIKREAHTYVLRPEGTASIARAYIENNLDKTQSGLVKLFYSGAMFRAERPQKGRLRQFHHIGCEFIGSAEPTVDIEVISLADRLLKEFGLEGYEIKLNSLGCARDKKELSGHLQHRLKDKLTHFCADCQTRFQQNTLRILDCKKEACQKLVSKLDLGENLCAECQAHFKEVKDGLHLLKIKYILTPYLVRGLDYYTRTVFEITHKELGSQDALGAGGRYDNLVSDLGGPQVAAIGFALGVERVLLVLSQEQGARSEDLVYIIPLGKEAEKKSTELLHHLRQQKITADRDYQNKSLKGALRKANDLGARFAVIIGEDEIKKNVVTLKDMISGKQKELKCTSVIEELISNNKAEN